uniref:SH2 domain-containing adapter protein E n=1 Tax=Gasterosteus aculeatus TaxID=69293 RepID=G3PEK7_GASAC
MARWFRDFPINLKNGNERVRSASESGPPRNQRKDGGVGGLLAGRNRKNSVEFGRNNAGCGGTVWDTLTPGKGRKNAKVEAGTSDENRQVRTTSLAQAYISRMIKVDKQDKTPKLNGITEHKQLGNETGRPDIKTTTLADPSTLPALLSPGKSCSQLIILEDYADPFDAEKTKGQREAERAGVNDGYMEPYDAQVIITEVRRRGSKDLLKVCVLLDRGHREGKEEERKHPPPNIYDTPYEGGLEGDSGGVWIPVTRPESDVRPAGEYELPWEWRKEDIVRALSAQFEAVDCSPTKENGSIPPRQQHQQQQLTLSAPLDGETAKVDPSLLLEKQNWYHGSVSRQQAEAQLQRCREASFLVRDSESGTSKYSIALKTSQSCVHIIVAQTKSAKGLGFTLDQSSCVFSSIPELVHHYCTHRLPFTGAEHMTLQHAVPRPH